MRFLPFQTARPCVVLPLFFSVLPYLLAALCFLAVLHLVAAACRLVESSTVGLGYQMHSEQCMQLLLLVVAMHTARAHYVKLYARPWQ